MPKWLQTAIGLCTLTAAILEAITYFATAEEHKQLEQKTIQTFDQFQKNIDKNAMESKLTILNDRKYSIRQELRHNPKDSLVLEDYKAIQKDIQKRRIL